MPLGKGNNVHEGKNKENIYSQCSQSVGLLRVSTQNCVFMATLEFFRLLQGSRLLQVSMEKKHLTYDSYVFPVMQNSPADASTSSDATFGVSRKGLAES